MRTNGESMPDAKIVEKILRTLTEKYLFVVVSIEESKNTEEMTIEELQSTLVVHEQKFKRVEKEDEQVPKMEEGESSGTRGRERGSRFSPRGRGRGRGRTSINKETIECYNCHRLGHFSYERPNSKTTNFAGFNESEEVMLMMEASIEEKCLMAGTSEESQNHLWFLDSGCSNHMCGIKERFVNLDHSFTTSVRLGNNSRMYVSGKGSVKLTLNGAALVITDVYYVPDLKNCLLSVGQLQQRGLSFLIQSDVCKVFHPERGLLFQSNMSTNRMFPLSEDTRSNSAQRTEGCNYTSDEDVAKLWHERLGHISKTSMGALQQRKMVRDLPSFSVDDDVCKDCLVGKQTREAIPKVSKWRAREGLELIHSDICGPITPSSYTGKRYMLSFIDDYSRKAWVYLLSEKSQTLEKFKEFKSMIETESGKVIKCLRTDRGGEYLSTAFVNFCKEHGIKRQLTTWFTPQQNGVAERKNRTVIGMIITLLASKSMPKMFWAEAAVWSFYVLNRSPSRALLNITPEEAWSGSKPTVDHLRLWGSLAHVHVPKEKRIKLDDRSFPCVLTGVSEESKAYRLIDPKSMKVVISRDVVFEEHKAWDWNSEVKRN
ncbi:putative RNA-directed DNA polymerase [Helianthus debilis subsp. tardiflorus]